MKQQLMECSAAVHASQESYPDHAIEEKLIKSLILETMKHIILLSTAILESQQNIIIGSRVNWAEDPSLKAVVLQLEKKSLFSVSQEK
ncbi:centromere protein H-like isoform X2 [Harpia harpyja]|uniref:centromere protein H-like isoform X2 n=1 Tax=Harpia harpyja TaxID=202280 RepID=UPI0022B117B4|nr:centromere protein H-like isoform X2 [Harpia harpyja]